MFRVFIKIQAIKVRSLIIVKFYVLFFYLAVLEYNHIFLLIIQHVS